MLINNQQVLQTLDKLSVPHQKVVDEHHMKNSFKEPISNTIECSLDDLIQVMTSLKALSVYNSFKQNYQLSVKNKG